MKQHRTELVAILMPDCSIQLEWSLPPADGPQHSGQVMQDDVFVRFTQDPDGWFFFLGFCAENIPLSPSLAFWRTFSALFIRKLKLTPNLEELRAKVVIPFTDEERGRLLESAPLMTGGEYLTAETLAILWAGLHVTFCRKMDAYAGTVADFLREYSPDVHLAGRIYFHLVENKDHESPFAFLATYSTRLNEAGESRHLPLKYALEEYKDDNEKLLRLLVTVDEAARRSALVANLRDNGELFYPLAWSSREAYVFLQEIPIYEEAGILCRIPNWWKKKTGAVTMQVSIGEKPPSTVGMDALLDFSPRLMIGDTEISEDEVRRLLRESEGLAFLKNKWVAVDPEKLRQTLEAFEKASKLHAEEGITLLDALRLSANSQKLLGDAAADIAGVSHGEWLRTVFGQLQRPESIARVKTSRAFAARLRHYQQDGLNWLCSLHRMRLGACLADDMGLGKTVQILAFLDVLKTEAGKAQKKAASLLVIPASLLANWSAEIQNFAPRLSFFIAHPGFHKPKTVPMLPKEKIDGLDLVITTYALAQRYEWLHDYTWSYVILDEAQAIKNPGTKQTKAVKSLVAANRIIMTGTPVENRLSDLWSLFDFINPGLLGNAKEFGEFTKRLGRHPDGYAGLRRVVSPFILRRLKTDKSIISDLPDKVEMKTWAAMSKKQVVLYGEVVASIREALEHTEGIQRKGLILSALIKFKQLCNHPSQYLGLDSFKEQESGKFKRLREICETIHEKRERVLVFTQFKEMTGPLSRFLATIFNREGLVLHGSVPVGQRKVLVEKFQGREYVPFFVLSLKAGGVGLNLTAASHVIHFDRWWNPAVENQATDRAFRIGQKKNVMVHKFLTQGTIEEKIDRMLVEKAKLSDEVVAASGEKWLTEMSNEELFELFTLHI
ncbi:DEAD/DEAH box helicase [Desulfopila sp. IMCC35006]|uniref:DEAD/DEAH box helicase n=1 Tax=Desulfopila sp. IMCC35006 TaxID=2569542 RepID=UPI0010ABDB82|nr:DEAD/DEAH box helicase [Desulfopila sp. IMCC35006]TKB27002.1 DEAD/DEAH box helicase [Desulfopila sp. IMCC35006]